MKIFFLIAARNLARNWRRSLSTVLAVSFAFAAINAFGGFSNYIIDSLREGHIYAQGNGHLSIFKDTSGVLGSGEDEKIISGKDVAAVTDLLKKVPGVVDVAARLVVAGLISNGIESRIFVGIGFDIDALERVRGRARGFLGSVKLYKGAPLSAERPFGVGVPKKLARKLDAGIGSPLILSGPTASNQYNAVDAEVIQLVDSPEQLLDDKLVVMPLRFAQEFYDTDGATQINVVLDESEALDEARDRIGGVLKAEGLGVTVSTWREISPFTVKVEKMFDVIFVALFMILSVIAVMSVINTISMSVLERTREIGALRAMGLNKKNIVAIISIESALMGLLGGITGLVILYVMVSLIHIVEPQWVPPQISRAIPLDMYISSSHMAISFLAFGLLSLFAGVLPAMRAVSKNIVHALTYT